ncbi:Hypothetical predicted protein [Cloeon dipterum]|uniref:Uncharacterized protein n=1 Tax=Cloeon dipterum TaxID=197152 RepID=A0A8S1CPZ0_9INSE|nr:Hypothetical predicted protein [Cloeon dipterum]
MEIAAKSDFGKSLMRPFNAVMLQLEMKKMISMKYPKSLKNTCKDFIRNKKNTFINGSSNPFSVLPDCLKTELIMMSKDETSWGKWEECLINKQMNSLVFFLEPSLVNVREAFKVIKDLFTSLDKVKPNVKSLRWEDNSDYSPILSSNHLKETTFLSSEYYTSLQELKIHCIASDEEFLNRIACCLKNLQVLDLVLAAVSPQGLSCLTSMKHLRVFLFTLACGTYFDLNNKYNILYNQCVQLMPKLQIIGTETDFKMLQSDFDSSSFRNIKIIIQFDSLPIPVELGLRQLTLHKNGAIPNGIYLPNLKSLLLWNPALNLMFDDRFSKVTSLSLIETNLLEILRILDKLGTQLKVLLLMTGQDDLQLDLILTLCPNLEEFHLPRCPAYLTMNNDLEPKADLEKLEVLRVELITHLDGVTPSFTPGVLVQLLRAPNLRELILHWIDFTQDEAEDIVKLLLEGEMLQKLERFEVENWAILEGQYHDAEIEERFDLVLTCMAYCCPRFVHLFIHDFSACN